jgi:hypothetical protein
MSAAAPRTFDLADFSLSDMLECGVALRGMAGGAETMEEVAGRTVAFLHERLQDRHGGGPACALIRFFKTHPYAGLQAGQQAAARQLLGGLRPPPAMKCLTLLASRGIRSEWNARASSSAHQAIPLPSEAVIHEAPMIAQLVRQFGLPTHVLVDPRPELLVDLAQRSFSVFHVAEAVGSPYIPAQEDFVVPVGIRSVLGFGGVLPGGDLFATILFSRVPIPRETAEAFQTIALAIKLAVLDFDDQHVFAAA